MPGLLLEDLMQLAQLRGGKLRQAPGKLVAQMPCLTGQSSGALQQSLRFTTRRFELLEFGLGP